MNNFNLEKQIQTFLAGQSQRNWDYSPILSTGILVRLYPFVFGWFCCCYFGSSFILVIRIILLERDQTSYIPTPNDRFQPPERDNPDGAGKTL